MLEFKVLRRGQLFIVLKNLVIVEVLAYLVFMALALSADWGKIYEGSVLARYIRFEVVEFSLLGIVQLGLIFFIFTKFLNKEKSIEEMMRFGEHERLEFKTSLRWDAKRNQVNKELEKTIMKTVAAFLNSEGGCLLIGIDDSGEPVGLENDFKSIRNNLYFYRSNIILYLLTQWRMIHNLPRQAMLVQRFHERVRVELLHVENALSFPYALQYHHCANHRRHACCI